MWIRRCWILFGLCACTPRARAPAFLQVVDVGPTAPLHHTNTRVDDSKRSHVVKAAKKFLDGAPLVVRGYQFESDPLGFVRAAFWSANMELIVPGVYRKDHIKGMEVLYRSMEQGARLHSERPQPGDLIFLQPPNKKQASASYPPQVAIVEKVDTDGTVTCIGYFAGGIARAMLNLRTPEQPLAVDGKVLNTFTKNDTKTSLARAFKTYADPY